MTRKIAIVSSYGEECGAAYYSFRLKEHLETIGKAQVDIHRLDVSLLRKVDRVIARKANRHVAEIAESLKDYDGVLMQFEPGLYGSRPYRSYPRALRLIKSHPNIVLTVHGFDRPSDTDFAGLVVSFLRSMYLFKRTWLAHTRSRRTRKLARRFWKTVRKLKNINVLTFCQADQKLLKVYYDLERVTHFPIAYFTQDQVASYRRANPRDAVLRSYGLDPAKKYAGIFGFLGHYKGHLTAIKMLEYLPEDYHLLVVGGEHPHAIEPETPIGHYLQQILFFAQYDPEKDGASDVLKQLLENYGKSKGSDKIYGDNPYHYFLPRKKLLDRIHFMGQVSDEEMPRLYCATDFTVLPYIKTLSGQSGSGPATLALEFGSKNVFSNAPVFRELARYFGEDMRFANVGNPIEFAQAVQLWDRLPAPEPSLSPSLARYSPRAMVAKYFELLGFGPLAPEHKPKDAHLQIRLPGTAGVREAAAAEE